MADLHVVSLRYALRPNEHVSFTNPLPMEFETDDARFRLAEGTLTCEMKTHFADPAEARRAVEPAIRAWEIDADLRLYQGILKFGFDGADVIDRTPPPTGVVHGTAYMVGSGLVTATGTASVRIGYVAYPAPPPPTFRLNPDAESVLARYQGYRDGREPLQSMAFFCLTLVILRAGRSQRAASAAYRIELPTLRKMGELSSTRGDAMNARKADAAKPLSAEHAWLEAAVKMLIWRLGDTRNAVALPMITMADLPKL